MLLDLQLTVSKTSTLIICWNVKLNKEGKTILASPIVHFSKVLDWIKLYSEEAIQPSRKKYEAEELVPFASSWKKKGCNHAQSNNPARRKSNVNCVILPCRTRYCLRFDALFDFLEQEQKIRTVVFCEGQVNNLNQLGIIVSNVLSLCRLGHFDKKTLCWRQFCSVYDWQSLSHGVSKSFGSFGKLSVRIILRVEDVDRLQTVKSLVSGFKRSSCNRLGNWKPAS